MYLCMYAFNDTYRLKAGVHQDFSPPSKMEGGGEVISITGSVTDKNYSERSHPEMSITQTNSKFMTASELRFLITPTIIFLKARKMDTWCTSKVAAPMPKNLLKPYIFKMILKCESCIESWIFPKFFNWLLFVPGPRSLNIRRQGIPLDCKCTCLPYPKPIEFVCFFVCFLGGFSSHSRIFHSYGDVTVTGEGPQVFTNARHLWPLSTEGSLATPPTVTRGICL